MRKLGFINYKGGTGKTSCVVNLGHALAIQGKKVLIIDTDPQGSIQHHLGVSAPYSLYEILMGEKTCAECIVNARPLLDVIVANERLYPAELLMAKMKAKETILSQRLASISGYDFVLLDCAPSINLLNQNVLLYATELLVPVSMEHLSLVGVKLLLNNIKIVNRIFGKSVIISKVIPTFFDKRNKKSTDILESLKRVFPDSMSSAIRSSVSLSEVPGFKKTIFDYDPNSKGAQDYNQLTQEVIEYAKTKEV